MTAAAILFWAATMTVYISIHSATNQRQIELVYIYIVGDGHINWYQVVGRHTSLLLLVGRFYEIRWGSGERPTD